MPHMPKPSVSHDATTMADLLDLEARAFRTRFKPRTRRQYYAAVATLWNLLDRNIDAAVEKAGCLQGGRMSGSRRALCGTPFGYMRPAQVDHYSSFVWAKGPQNYCEIGFNGGHGTVAMLLANPQLNVLSFDIGGYPYSKVAVQIVSTYFGRRFRYVQGDSHVVVPAHARNRTNRWSCDVLLVDGDHSAVGSLEDLKNMRILAKPGAVVLIDDVQEGPGKALSEAERLNLARVESWHTFNRSTVGDRHNPCIRRVRPPMWACHQGWGWAVARYV